MLTQPVGFMAGDLEPKAQVRKRSKVTPDSSGAVLVSGAASINDGTSLPALFSWPVRAFMMVIAFAGSAVYALSYRAIHMALDVTPIATAIGVAGATAWIGFGFLLLTVAQMKPRRYAGVCTLHWADACLLAMSVGIALKMIGVGVNVIAAAMSDGPLDLALVAPMQLVLLVTADIVMGAVFIRRAGRLRLPRTKALLLWIVALNGIFAGVLAGLIAYGGFMP